VSVLYEMSFDTLPDILTPKQLANYLQVSDITIKRALKSGKLRGFHIGRDWRIEKEAVPEWLHEYGRANKDGEVEISRRK
jgi:excisionase family DNA binding protein